MTRAFDERLEAARKLVAAARAAGPPGVSVHLADQFGAAADEAYGFVMGLGAALALAEPSRAWTGMTGFDAPNEVSARALAALGGIRACPHLRRDGPQPAWAFLALHRLDCRRCARTFRKPPAGEERRCDWCGAGGVEWFTAVAVQQGPVTVLGDACGACAEGLGLPAAEVAG